MSELTQKITAVAQEAIRKAVLLDKLRGAFAHYPGGTDAYLVGKDEEAE